MSCGLLFHSKFDFATLSYVARGTSTAQPIIIIIIIRLWVVLFILPPPHRIVHILCVRLLNFNAHIYSRNPISLTQNKYLCGGRNCAVFSHQKRINWLVNQEKNVLIFLCVSVSKSSSNNNNKNPQSCFDFDKTVWKPLILFAPGWRFIYRYSEEHCVYIGRGFLFCSVLLYLHREKAKHKNVPFESYNGFYMTKWMLTVSKT